MEWSEEKSKSVKAFIITENKKASLFSRFKTYYYSWKYRIQDWISGE